MKLNLQLIKSKNLSRKLLHMIVKLKKQSWNYSINSQIKWFLNYTKNNDKNYLFFYNSKLAGYTLITKRLLIYGNIKSYYYLLDTIIVDKNHRKRGFGNYILSFLLKNYFRLKYPLLVITEKKNYPFYKKNNLIKLSKKKIIFNDYNTEGRIILTNKPFNFIERCNAYIYQ